MQNKNILYVIGLLILLTCLVSVNAINLGADNVTIVRPAVSGTYSQNITLSILLQSYESYNAQNYTTAQFWAYSPSTANNSYIWLQQTLNDSSTSFNITFNTTYLEDAKDYTLKVTIKNGTASADINKTISGTFTINNTFPTTPTSLTPSTSTIISTTTVQTFSSYVTNSKTTNCTYVIARGGATSGNDYTTNEATYSGSTCSFTKTFSNSNDNGEWLWYITANDGTDTAQSTRNSLSVQFAGSGGGLPGTPTTDSQTDCISKGYSWSNGVCYKVIENELKDYMLFWIIGTFLIILIIYIEFKIK